MSKHLIVGCPFCHGSMEVNSETGEVLQKWEPSNLSKSSEDRMSDALKKIEESKKKRATLFDQTKSELENKKRKSEDVFEKEVKRIKKEGIVEKPLNPFELD